MAKKKELLEEKAEKKSGARAGNKPEKQEKAEKAGKKEKAEEKPEKAGAKPRGKPRAGPKTEAQEKRDALKRELEERGIKVKEIAVEAPEKEKFSGERKISEKKAPEWVEYKPRQIEQLIVQMANAGHGSSEIGMLLRDQYGIPNVEMITKKSILKMLQENNLAPKMPEDLMNLIKKSLKLHKHMQLNKKDMSAKHGYVLTVSKIRKLSNYYQRMGRLAKDWRYSTEEAELLMK